MSRYVCPTCRKVLHTTRAEAETAVKHMRRKNKQTRPIFEAIAPLNSYVCPMMLGGWHIGHNRYHKSGFKKK